MTRRPGLAKWTLALLASVAIAAPARARADLVWGAKDGFACETPSTFYSSRHVAGRRPCCPLDDGVCPGGGTCPASGVCAGGIACVPARTARPNVVLFIADDQGECHYGSAHECRSVQSGTAIPAPVTPNLDAIAAGGTVFTIAHNTAAWCYPSLNTILTGRYQKSFGGTRNQIGSRYLTIPRTLRTLGATPDTVPDPFDTESRIGGYCTLQGGKFTASAGRQPGFNARMNGSVHKLGRIDCTSNPAGGPPLCGTDGGATYDPFGQVRMRDLFRFVDGMVYHEPASAEGAFTMQQFFVWYAPRIPHQPLRAPAPIDTYLFGPGGNTGLFQLGQLCTGGSCSPIVQAFDENNFGTVREYYANVYLADANLGEIRKFLQRTGAPHCIGAGGAARFDVATPQACRGTWATSITPDPATNTIIVYLSDNGWQLPDSKHNFSENGYRTRLLVFDPRTSVAGIETPALAHSTDLLPSILGFALDTPPGTQACPTSDFDETPCDGRDFRAQLATVPVESRAPLSALRRSLCGHETQRPAHPGRRRYLLTGSGTVGRCALPAGAACVAATDCSASQFCLGGVCAERGGHACGSSAACPAGALCLDGRCLAGPPCVDDANCAPLLGAGATCVAKETSWCANAPDTTCTTREDCPACPTINGHATACHRVCEPRRLKLYDQGGNADLTDLFGDPDEKGLREGGPGRLATLLSDESGPYGATIRNLSCCLDDWWNPVLHSGSLCGTGDACPAELTCNR